MQATRYDRLDSQRVRQSIYPLKGNHTKSVPYQILVTLKKTAHTAECKQPDMTV